MARNAPASAALSRFAELLGGHLRTGTRPATAAGEPWTYAAFASEVTSSRTTQANDFVSPRSVSNWCKGASLPLEIEPILRALFGPSDRHALARDELRKAFQIARASKYGAEIEGPTAADDVGPSKEIPLKLPAVSEAVVEFISTFEPDDLTLELLFEELFRRSARVVTVAPGRFTPPKGREEIAQFCTEVSKDPIQVSWPGETLQLIGTVDKMQRDVRRYRDKDSVFNGVDSSTARLALQALSRCSAFSHQAMTNIPKRIPWVWLALMDYYGPFSSGSNIFRAIKNYLRFGNLRLYHNCASTLHHVARHLSLPLPAGTNLIDLHSRWEHSISIFFNDPFESEKDNDVVVSYVPKIEGVHLASEATIYGPRSLATLAYRQSMDRQPIICRWFAHYLVPQVELQMATEKPEEPTTYNEEAWIRKVTTLSGSDLDPDRRALW